jgi:hypothetical protein
MPVETIVPVDDDGRMRLLAACTLLFASLALPLEGAAKIPDPSRGLVSCAAYTQYDELGPVLESYAASYPAIARTFVAGKSLEGRDILGIVVSTDPGAESDEPEIRIVGAHHGDECITVDLVLAIVEWLVTSYGDDGLVSDLVDGAEIVLVPLVNPDGNAAQPATRENAAGVDLNRNYHLAWHANGAAPFSEPETRAVRDLGESHAFALGLTYHTRANYINGPWNYTPHHPWDEALVAEIAAAYDGTSPYQAVFGWDWYPINGDLNDWSYGTHGTLDWTVELRSDTQLQLDIHGPGVANFLSYAFVGAEGVVTDAKTGAPLRARITVEPRGAPIFTDPAVGDFHRILLPGAYDITAAANGHAPRTAHVQVPDGDTIVADFALEAGDEYAALAVAGTTLPQIIQKGNFTADTYLNSTMAFDALGAPDGAFYSLSPAGSVTLDMGAGTEVTDRAGADLEVVSGTGSADPVQVLVAADEDGPFVQVASGQGDLEVDIAASGLARARYVRLADVGQGPFNEEFAGYDVDAVVNLSPPPPGQSDGGTDTGGDGSVDTGSETGGSTDEDASADGGFYPGSAGCGCQAAGKIGPMGLIGRIFS